MEDHTNKHVQFFAALEELPRKLDEKIINHLLSMANSGEFLDNLVQTSSPRLEKTIVWGKLRDKTQNIINHRLNEIITFIKNQNEPLQEQERIKDLIIKIKK